MLPKTPEHFVIYPEVAQALQNHQPVVALESAVITHGLPHPENLNLAIEMETEIRNQGAIPATIALLAGKIHIGLSPIELERLADPELITRKISRRDYGVAIASQEYGGTTVAGTLIAARATGIKVFATGGIGGVHRNASFDISADLPELSRSPLVVVCAGAKAILDLPATLEYLETMGVPVIGYQTNEFPAFYSIKSGLQVNIRVDDPRKAAQIALAQWDLGLDNSILIVQPPPTESAIPYDEVNNIIELALRESQEQHINGSAVTPFLLNKVSELSHGSSLRANLALLRNNARLAAQVAREPSNTSVNSIS
jgi:pseudouridine-5'-phosphate glycosidase